MSSELVKKFTPVLWLHKDEKYFPCSIDWMLQHSTLKDFNTGMTVAPVTQRDLFEIAKKYDFKRRADGDVILSFPPDTYRGEAPLSNVPCYALVRERGDLIYITYLFVFTYNGEYNILGLAEAGQHPGDIEHITVEVDKKTGGLLRVFFSAHGTKDGRWVPAKDLEYLNGQIVCYVALSGHGLYPNEGTVFRLGGIGNDYLNKGFLWRPRAIEFFSRSHASFNPDTMGFFAYNSRIGGHLIAPNTEGITGLPDKSWIQNVDKTDATFYNPPKILAPKTSNVGGNLKELAKFALIYFAIFLLLLLVTKFMRGKTYSPMIVPFTIKDHIATIALAVIIFLTYKKVGAAVIMKFAPS